MLAAFASERSSLRFWELKWFLISMDARPTCHRRRVVGCGGGGSKTAAKKRSWLRLCVSFMYVFHLCIKTGWRVGFCERALLGAPVGRTRPDAQRARSTTTHGRSRCGHARRVERGERGRRNEPRGTFRRDFSNVLQSFQGRQEGASRTKRG